MLLNQWKKSLYLYILFYPIRIKLQAGLVFHIAAIWDCWQNGPLWNKLDFCILTKLSHNITVWALFLENTSLLDFLPKFLQNCTTGDLIHFVRYETAFYENDYCPKLGYFYHGDKYSLFLSKLPVLTENISLNQSIGSIFPQFYVFFCVPIQTVKSI